MRLFVISGPSGVGKTTLTRKLVEMNKSLRLCVSCTTRPKRNGEVNGSHYHFLDTDTFLRLREKEEFLEWAEVHGYLYGTLKKELFVDIRDPVLEIDCQGAAKVMKVFKAPVLIFILPPSLEALEERILERRRGESPEEISERLRIAREEIAQATGFKYQVVNENFDKALKELLRWTSLSRLQ